MKKRLIGVFAVVLMSAGLTFSFNTATAQGFGEEGDGNYKVLLYNTQTGEYCCSGTSTKDCEVLDCSEINN